MFFCRHRASGSQRSRYNTHESIEDGQEEDCRNTHLRDLIGKRGHCAASPHVANERATAMPEPAGQRVTGEEASGADSVTFVSVAVTSPTYEEIAEAAYHRYLSRGGGDGRDFDDWIEAERALKTR